MWIDRMRIGRANNLAEQLKGGIGQPIFFQDRIKRNVFALMAEFTVWNIKNCSVLDLRPVGFSRKKNEFGIGNR